MDRDLDAERDEALRRVIRDVRRVKLVHIALVIIAGLALLAAVWLKGR